MCTIGNPSRCLAALRGVLRTLRHLEKDTYADVLFMYAGTTQEIPRCCLLSWNGLLDSSA
jgi:hypothetical protein